MAASSPPELSLADIVALIPDRVVEPVRQRAKQELARFLQLKILAQDSDARILSPSHAVDEFWHSLILETRAYARLQALAKLPIRHRPEESDEPGQSRRYASTLAEYAESFGAPPPSMFWPPAAGGAGARAEEEAPASAAQAAAAPSRPRRRASRSVRASAAPARSKRARSSSVSSSAAKEAPTPAKRRKVAAKRKPKSATAKAKSRKAEARAKVTTPSRRARKAAPCCC